MPQQYFSRLAIENRNQVSKNFVSKTKRQSIHPFHVRKEARVTSSSEGVSSFQTTGERTRLTKSCAPAGVASFSAIIACRQGVRNHTSETSRGVCSKTDAPHEETKPYQAVYTPFQREASCTGAQDSCLQRWSVFYTARQQSHL